jgi:hypothetical protein
MKLHPVQLVGSTLGGAGRMWFYIVDLLGLY